MERPEQPKVHADELRLPHNNSVVEIRVEGHVVVVRVDVICLVRVILMHKWILPTFLTPFCEKELEKEGAVSYGSCCLALIPQAVLHLVAGARKAAPRKT